jgi:hypothetical protein
MPQLGLFPSCFQSASQPPLVRAGRAAVWPICASPTSARPHSILTAPGVLLVAALQPLLLQAPLLHTQQGCSQPAKRL